MYKEDIALYDIGTKLLHQVHKIISNSVIGQPHFEALTTEKNYDLHNNVEDLYIHGEQLARLYGVPGPVQPYSAASQPKTPLINLLI